MLRATARLAPLPQTVDRGREFSSYGKAWFVLNTFRDIFSEGYRLIFCSRFRKIGLSFERGKTNFLLLSVFHDSKNVYRIHDC